MIVKDVELWYCSDNISFTFEIRIIQSHHTMVAAFTLANNSDRSHLQLLLKLLLLWQSAIPRVGQEWRERSPQLKLAIVAEFAEKRGIYAWMHVCTISLLTQKGKNGYVKTHTSSQLWLYAEPFCLHVVLQTRQQISIYPFVHPDS